MNDTLRTIIIALFTSIASGLGGWIFARKKNAAEAKSVELENVSKAVEIWREAAENLNAQLKLYTEQFEKMRQENEDLRKKISDLESQIEQLKKAKKKDC